MATAKDPMTADFLEGHRLKGLAIKSLNDLELYQQAAERFHEAGKQAVQNQTDPASDDEAKEAGRVFGPYYLYEEERCLTSYSYEKRDTAKATEHLEKAGVLLRDHIDLLEQEVKTTTPETAARLTSILATARYYQRDTAVWSEAIPARAAWDEGRFIDALDRYRRMVRRHEELIEHAKGLKDPAYERISLGNFIGAMGNCSAAMVEQHLTISGVQQVEEGKTIPIDLACDLLRHMLQAYLYGTAAFDANPEWIQYRAGAMLCRRDIEKSLADNKDAWAAVYARFLDEPEFLKIMAAVDMERYRALTQNGATGPMPSTTPIRILFLAANPKDTKPLRLDEELRTIEERLRLSKHAELFEIKQSWAVRVSDLQEALLRHDPHIVHFSGHGADFGEITLENVQGVSHSVPPAALADLFRVLKGSSIRVVVLNSCGSLSQAEAIKEHVDFVIGMADDIGDEAAIAFAASMYQGLGYGKSVKDSFELGCNQIHLAGLAEEHLPKLLTKIGCDPSAVTLVDSLRGSTPPVLSPMYHPQLSDYAKQILLDGADDAKGTIYFSHTQRGYNLVVTPSSFLAEYGRLGQSRQPVFMQNRAICSSGSSMESPPTIYMQERPRFRIA